MWMVETGYSMQLWVNPVKGMDKKPGQNFPGEKIAGGHKAPGCSQRAEVHGTSLPCALAPPHPAGGSSPLPGPHLWILLPYSLPTGLSRQKENVLRDTNVKREEFCVHSNFPATGIPDCCSSFSVLGAWLGHLWSMGFVHPASLILCLEAA